MMPALLPHLRWESGGLRKNIQKPDFAANQPVPAASQAKMRKYEHYEVWVLESGEWTRKSFWRDFEVAWAAAGVHAGPVRIVREMYEDGEEAERKIVVELRVVRNDAGPEPPFPAISAAPRA